MCCGAGWRAVNFGMLRALAAAALLAACSTAQAQRAEDPVAWNSAAVGRVVYALESGSSGVLEYPVPFGDNVGRFYIDGLAGEFGGPGPLDGYWSEPDVSHDDEDDTTLICPFPIIDDHGRTTRNWGRLTIMFPEDDFPADFMLLRGRCFETPRDPVSGKLIR
jgi:hypothetical protein